MTTNLDPYNIPNGAARLTSVPWFLFPKEMERRYELPRVCFPFELWYEHSASSLEDLEIVKLLGQKSASNSYGIESDLLDGSLLYGDIV